MINRVVKAGGHLVLVAVVLAAMAGCRGGGGGGSTSSSSVQGIETPSSVSVVSANNAN